MYDQISFFSISVFLLSMFSWLIRRQFHLLLPMKQLYENSLRAKAFAIVHSCISMLGSMSGVYQVDYLFVYC